MFASCVTCFISKSSLFSGHSDSETSILETDFEDVNLSTVASWLLTEEGTGTFFDGAFETLMS
jgi:hypothetical protein